MKKKISFIILSFLVVLGLAAACTGGGILLDKEHAAMLRCNIEDGATGKVVRITGFSGHSAYVVRKIDVLPEVKGVVVVKIHLRLTDGKPSSSGDFDVQIPLIETLESIALAKPSDIIWTKPKK